MFGRAVLDAVLKLRDPFLEGGGSWMLVPVLLLSQLSRPVG